MKLGLASMYIKNGSYQYFNESIILLCSSHFCRQTSLQGKAYTRMKTHIVCKEIERRTLIYTNGNT